jgi:hypothetical protein
MEIDRAIEDVLKDDIILKDNPLLVNIDDLEIE